jgi:hypothetical protein
VPRPETVVTAAPSTVHVRVRQLSTASPFTSTAQAPQSPFSQPLLTSKQAIPRIVSNRVSLGRALTSRSRPLTVRRIILDSFMLLPLPT